MADPFAAFEGRYGRQSGGGDGGDIWSNWEKNFTVARLDPKKSQKAGGLDRLNEQQLATFGYKPSDIPGWDDLPERKQKKLEDVLINAISKSSPTLNTSYKPGSLPNNNVQNMDLGKYENRVKAVDQVFSNTPKMAEAFGQSFYGGLGREAINLAPMAAAPFGLLGLAAQLAPQTRQLQEKAKYEFFPEAGVKKNSLSPTRLEDYDPGMQAARLAGSAGKGVVETIGTGALGNVMRAGAAGSGLVKALSGGGKVAQGASKVIPWLAESVGTSGFQSMGNGGDVGRGVVEGVGYDAAFNALTKGFGKIAKTAGTRGARELTEAVKNQNTAEDVMKVIQSSSVSNKIKKEVLAELDKTIPNWQTPTRVTQPTPAAPRSTAMSIADDFSPSERAVFEAMNDPKIPQPDKFDAGLRAYKTVNPTATPQEAADATFGVLKKAGNDSIGGVKKAFGQVDMAADTGIKNTGVKAKVREIFNPIKNLSDDTQKSFQKAAAGRYVGQTERATTINEIRQTAKQTGTKLDMDLAHKIESGEVDDVFTRQFREVADKARQEGIDAGLDIGYKENYLPHIWKQSEEKVDEIARGFGMKPRATGERIIPTYEEGLKLGLTPKYKDPADMMGDYVQNIQNARSNVALIGDLKAQGMIAEASGRPPAGWAHITAEAFPKSSSGNQLIAPKEIAAVIDNLYGTKNGIIEKALGKTAKFNSVWQDIALAGGVPKTPANFFTFSQMMKEGATGLGDILTGHPVRGSKTLLNPLGAFISSFSKNSTAKIELKNKDFLKGLAQAGAPIHFSTEGKKLVSWDSMFNDPTFGRFMPTMQLGTAKNIYGGLEKKLGAEKAMQETASIMKKLYGITDQLMTGRSGAVQDLIGSVGFAPKYRESIVNVLGNTVKSLDPRTYKDVSYSLNRRLAAGMGVTFLIYDQINKQTTGHGMFQNPSGKELQLAIPYGEDEKGNKKVLYIPFMPSFMTLPRAAVGAAQSIAKGDMGGVGSELGKMLSMPLQVGSQLASNRDYFGRPIVIDEKASQETGESIDSGIDKLKKQAMYLLGQASPAAVRAGIDASQGKPLEQVLAQAGEVPVRFGKFYGGKGTSSDVAPGQVSGDFYKVYNVLESQSRKMEKDINKDIYQGTGSNAKEFANQYNNRVNEMFANFFAQYGDKLKDEDRKKYESMADNIKIEVKDKKKGGLYVNKY